MSFMKKVIIYFKYRNSPLRCPWRIKYKSSKSHGFIHHESKPVVLNCHKTLDLLHLCYYPNSRVIPSFRPRFAGKCDWQSRDLTQLTSGYISRLNRLLITPDHHVRTHTWERKAQKYSTENMNIFYTLAEIECALEY